MTKIEFDNRSAVCGFGPCANYMWPEIERCYSTSDEIDRDLMVDIYWYEPLIYREILGLRYAIADAARAMAYKTGPDGCCFPEARWHAKKIQEYYELLDRMVEIAKQRRAKRIAKEKEG